MGAFIFNPLAIAELQVEALAGMKEIADERAEFARSIAPVGDPATDPHPGQFRDSIESDAGIEDGIAVGRILTTDPVGLYIELGTSDTPPHPTLQRAIEG
jgi:hypothetical protein